MNALRTALFSFGFSVTDDKTRKSAAKPKNILFIEDLVCRPIKTILEFWEN